jgi:hypothetical protein
MKKVTGKELNNNYSVLMEPKFVNTVLELIRSFLIVYSEGPEYVEGWLLQVVTLVQPGMPPRALQDSMSLCAPPGSEQPRFGR